MDKLEIIEKLFTEREREELIPILPDQWTKRNKYLIEKSMQDRFMLNKDGKIVDLFQHTWIAARQMHWRLTELLHMVRTTSNDAVLGYKLREYIVKLEGELNL